MFPLGQQPFVRFSLTLLHGCLDDVGAMDSLLMAELLGFVEPFSGHVPQQAPVAHCLLQVPARTADSKFHMGLNSYVTKIESPAH